MAQGIYPDPNTEADNVPQVGSLRLIGHSYIDPRGVGITEDSDWSVAKRIETAFGLLPTRVENLAVSGGAVRQHNSSCSYATVLQNVSPGKREAPRPADAGVVFAMWATNDAVLGSTENTWLEYTFKSSYQTAIARYQAASVYENNDATCVYSGTWVEQTHPVGGEYGSGTTYHDTNTTSSKVTITTPNDMGRFETGVYVDLGLIMQSEHGVTAEVWLDGVKHGDVDCGNGASNGTWPGGGDAGQKYGYIYRLWIPTTVDPSDPLKTTQHTIELRYGTTVNSGSGKLMFDYWQISTVKPPLILLGSMPQPSNPGWVWAGIANPVVHDNYNRWLGEIVSWFNTPAVRLVDLDTPLEGTTGTWSINSNAKYYSTDGLHPNSEGARVIASAVYAEYVRAITTNLDPQHVLGHWSEAADPLLTPPNWYTGVGMPFALDDNFDRAPSTTIGGTGWTQMVGSWGVDGYGQAYISRSKFLVPTIDDDFTRANSTSSPGGAWTVVQGTFGISSNTTYVQTNGASNKSIMTQDVGSTSQWAELTVAQRQGSVNELGLIMRYSNASNFISIQGNSLSGWTVFKVVAGVISSAATVGGVGSASANQGIHVEIGSDNIMRFWQVHNGSGTNYGVKIATTYTITDAALQAAGSGTKVGIGAANTALTSSSRVDNFKAGAGTNAFLNAYTANHNLLVKTIPTNGAVGFTVGDNGSGINYNWMGLAYRIQDPDNFYYLYASATFLAWGLAKVVGGTATQIGSGIITSPKPGSKVAVAYNGNDHSVYVNGVFKTTINDSTYPVGTLGGLAHFIGINNTTESNPRWDDFSQGAAYFAQEHGAIYLDTNIAGTALYGGQKSDGTWPAPVVLNPNVPNTIVYTGAGTFVKANYPGLKAVHVRCVGGGGAGGGAAATAAGQISLGGGGGGGSYSEATVDAADMGASVAVTVGLGGTGAAGVAGGNGGATGFGSFATTGGGNGGATTAAGAAPKIVSGGVRATAGAGDFVLPGPAGHPAIGISNTEACSGQGADGQLGTGGQGRFANNGGQAATGYGAGGGGASRVPSTGTTAAGGDGSDGICIVELIY